MSFPRDHHYRMATRWTGNLGSGTSSYTAYSRNHELSAEHKTAAIPGSSDPLFLGDRTRYNPEELLLGAIASCHMLWVLHLCADAGITVTSYQDEATGEMTEQGDGSGQFTRIVLHPRMAIADSARVEDAKALHGRAHGLCALARSMNFPVEIQPSVLAEKYSG
jgi:organic hydroperoxide reductase OsmC/OhrA